jgi:hypothetical protein
MENSGSPAPHQFLAAILSDNRQTKTKPGDEKRLYRWKQALPECVSLACGMRLVTGDAAFFFAIGQTRPDS